MTTQTQKVAQRTNKGNTTGTVFVLQTVNDSLLGLHYIFSMTKGEFGKEIYRFTYVRLPSNIRKIFI
jgi:hypothetical protein